MKILGAILIVLHIAIAAVSRFFVFGQGYEDRPILLFLFLILLTFICYFLACHYLRKEIQSPRLFGWILFVSVILRMVYLPSSLIQESDPYRYIWDGQQCLHGINPYQSSPKDLAHSHSDFATPRSNAVYERINHPGVKTIYPPGAQFLFAFSQLFSPWKLWGWRFLILGFEIMGFLLLAKLLSAIEIKQEWVLLYGWSPLVIKEFMNSLHLDVFAIFFLIAVLYFSKRGRPVLAHLFLACSALIKFYAILFLPLLFIYSATRHSRNATKGLLLFFGVFALAYVPFLTAGMSLFDGLFAFSSRWQTNDSLFSLIRWILTWLEFSPALLSRLVAAGFLLTFYTLILRNFIRQINFLQFVRASGFVVLIALLFSPVANPWYFTWLFPFLIFYPRRSWILLTGLVFLYYLDFYFAYRGHRELFLWVRIVEYGIFFTVFLWEWIFQKEKSRLFSLSSTNPN